MRVGVVDIGANTIRLLVAAPAGGGVVPVRRERVRLGLGEHVEKMGRLPQTAIDDARRAARKQVAIARRLGCSRVEIVVTSPGRQAANADALVFSLAGISDATVRVLSAEDEAVYAYHGALSGLDGLPETVAVCDVGGGSTQIVVGSRDAGPEWVRSLDIGSSRLTRRAFVADPPTAAGLDRARALVAPPFAKLSPPLPQAAYATGGSARAVAGLVGESLGAAELAVAMRILSERSSRRVAKTFDLSLTRARTITAGTLLLSCAQQLLGVPLVAARGGLREGVALSLLADAALAAYPAMRRVDRLA